MTQTPPPRWATADGWFVADLGEAASRGPGPCILSPITAALPSRLADMACALPIGDANGRLLQAVTGIADLPWTLAGVLAGDPFRRPRDLLAALSDRGVRAVINWPSVGLLSGELAGALTHSEFTYGRELAMLQAARVRAMAVATVVCTRDQLTEALVLDPEMLLVVPGLVAGRSAEREARVAEVDWLLQQAQARAPQADLRLYLHPEYETELAPLAARACGVIRHAAPANAQVSP